MNKRTAYFFALAAALACAAGAPAVAGNGLNAPQDESVWPTWQARLTLSTASGPGWTPSRPLAQAALLGDWYFSAPDGGPTARWRGGFRATGGLVLGHLGHLGHSATVSAAPWSVSLLSAPDARRDPDAVLRTYVGLGYAGISADGGLSFSADVGLFGPPALNHTLQQLELAPVLRLGVHYAF